MRRILEVMGDLGLDRIPRVSLFPDDPGAGFRLSVRGDGARGPWEVFRDAFGETGYGRG